MTDERKKRYKECTDEIFLLYECFQESGFDKDQAFDLAAIYVRQSMFDNVMRENKEARDSYRRYLEKARTNRSAKMNEKSMGEQR